VNRPIERVAEAAARHRTVVLIAAGLITALAAWGAAHLPVRTSRKALFPEDEPVQQRLDSFIEKFGAASDLMVVLEGAPRPTLEAFATALTERLRGLPTVLDASARLDTDFLFSHLYLMIPPETLQPLKRLMDRALAAPPPAWSETVTLGSALESIERWLEEPPPLSESDVGLNVVEQGLQTVDVLLQEWLRFVETAPPPQDLAWERLAQQPEAERFLKGQGYFATHDGRTLIVFVSRRDPSSEFPVLQPFIEQVRAQVEALRAEYQARGGPVPMVGFTGLPAVEYEEFTAVQADIVLVVTSAAILIILLVFAWMRSLRRALVIFIPMGIGTVWNMGLTVFTVGHLTLLTAAFTAILFGLGVDYGIFLTSRIQEEREHTGSPEDLVTAIARGTAASFRAITISGSTTVLIFLSLVVAPFRGFAELGIVAGTGVLMVVLATILVGPALFAALPPPRSHALRGSTRLESVRPRLALTRTGAAVVVAVSLLAAALGIGIGAQIPFNYDALDLLPSGSEAARLQRKLVAESDFQPEVLLVAARDMPEARRLARELKNLSVVSSVQSVVDLFPPDAQERAEVARKIAFVTLRSRVEAAVARQEVAKVGLEEAARLITVLRRVTTFVEDVQDQAFSAGHARIVERLEQVRGRLAALIAASQKDADMFRRGCEAFFERILQATRKAVRVISDWAVAGPLTPSDLPESLRSKFFAADGSIALYVYPRFSVYDLGQLDHLMESVEGVAPQVTGFPATHRVFSRMAVQSFWTGSLLALVVALITILVSVRSWLAFITASIPLVVGCGWMLGLMAAFGMTFNYANIVGVPIVMALAVDYGVWFAMRRRERSDVSVWSTATVASRAILLAAGTTVAGLGAIMMGRYRGVASMGACVTLGLVCCLLAARVVAPAVSEWLEGRK